MSTEHPITPPPELAYQWRDETCSQDTIGAFDDVAFAARAARWGADQELEACVEWLGATQWCEPGGKCLSDLRAARRPKPLSLKQMCLMHLSVMERDGHYIPEILGDLRRALEALPDE